MSNIEERVTQRIDFLIEKGQKAKENYIQGPKGYAGASHLDYTLFNEWKSGSENIIMKVAGRDSSYFTNFIEQTKNAWPKCAESGIGILRALKEDVEKGFLLEVRQLATAEVFSDFLDIAQHLLDAGYKDPAASLVGAVLEDGLRTISAKEDITVKNGDDIGSLNTKLATTGTYNRLIQKQIQAWKDIRNSADHGKFEDYSMETVQDMLNGVQRFLSESL